VPKINAAADSRLFLLTGCIKTAPKPHQNRTTFQGLFEFSGAISCRRRGRYLTDLRLNKEIDYYLFLYF